jgi:FolB domain-containing protein
MDIERMDRIRIKDLLVRTVIGVNPEERGIKQDVVLNLTMYSDQRPAAAADDFELTVDYKSTKLSVLSLAENSSFRLIESLAAAVADLLLGIDGVTACEVSVDKPGALRFARSVAVEIYRERE